ncbi:hypothetical protein DMN91_011542 [Ooceraea biroi]|uniref:EndoU domain-containing protein n=1 Tax=Ooceraea biroi TaxID=2015173 RepID=A0A3L8D6C2_OOCBI|nr:poly(U)-specific endoribonuclease homolog [Ooceraea biroi]RLU15786.1 hypothetical protein DMN91_011542 [Ooceraea biroi]
MKVKDQFFIIFVISLLLLIENSEAGWKFWKKEETTTTTTTTATPISISVQPTATPTRVTTVREPTSSTVNTRAAVAGAANPGLAIGASTTGENVRNSARPSRPNPGTEVGQDISLPRPSRPGVGGGSGQGYRDWAAGLTGAGEPSRNQPSRISTQEPPINGADQTQPKLSTDRRPGPETTGQLATSRPAINLPDSRFTTPRNVPTQPSVTASRPTSTQPTQPHVTRASTTVPSDVIDRIRSSTPSPNSSGKTWADVAAGGSRPSSPTGLPRQPEYPRQPIPDNSQHWATSGRPTQPNQPSNPSSRPASPGDTIGTTAGAAATGAGAVAGVTLGGNAGGASRGTAASDSTRTTYSSNPTYSKGNTVTDEDLEKLSEALYIKETNNANRYVTINLQKQTTSGSPTDQAPQPLLTVSAEALQIPTIQKVLSIFDNYQLDTHTNEYISPAQRQEESLLIDTFLSTNVMSAAMRFLADKGFIRKDYYEYKDRLRLIWFNLFSRGQGKIGSTGFEHVFMAETKQVDSNTEVLGLHNWIYFNAEEANRHADYLGYIRKVDLGNKGSIVKMHAKFNGHDKPVTTMFIGTSPELEMALYTVCFYTRPDGNCPVSLGNTKFNIVTRKFRYRGKDLVGTAYPEI